VDKTSLRNNDPETNGNEKPSRRKFLDYLLGTGAFATFGAVFYPIFRFMVPPQVIEAQTNSVVAAKISEVANNSGKIFKFGSKPGLIVRTQAGDLKAFSASCTHLDCIVQYQPDENNILCACHNGIYDMSGKNVSGPPPRPLEEFSVNVKGDDIIVSKKG
jgi:Rieske Fe-S protein